MPLSRIAPHLALPPQRAGQIPSYPRPITTTVEQAIEEVSPFASPVHALGAAGKSLGKLGLNLIW
jgi:hypothetical protein